MGIPRRDGGGGSFQVNIRPLVKSCAEEQGFGKLMLPTGTRILATGLHQWPNQDRGLVEALFQLIEHWRPHLIVLPGNMLNEEAFKQVVDSQDRMRKLVSGSVAPELRDIQTKHRGEGVEEHFLALAQLGGKYIESFAKFGSHVIYIPALQASGQMPNEMGAFDFVLGQKAKADKLAERHPEEGKEGPPIPTDFAQFIGLDGHEDVTVAPFGAALRINGVRFIGGDYKRRQPASASQVDVEHTAESHIRLGDGKASSAYWTTPVHSLGGAHRRWWQAHEIGNMFDLKQLGFLRNYDRRAKGIWAGTAVGGKLFGTAIVPLMGRDGRRSFVLDGVAYTEETPFRHARSFSLAKVKIAGKPIAQDSATVAKAAKASAKNTGKAPAAKAKAKAPGARRATTSRSSKRGNKK